MELHNLKPADGSVKKGKRIGRGEGSTRGGTSTRGHKGAQSRSGYSRKEGFEGGQMPLYRRIPKFGFTNPNRVSFRAVNLYTIETIAKEKNLTEINPEILLKNGLISKNDKVKILGQGKLSQKLEIKAHAFSKNAVKEIEAQGGSAIKI